MEVRSASEGEAVERSWAEKEGSAREVKRSRMRWMISVRMPRQQFFPSLMQFEAHTFQVADLGLETVFPWPLAPEHLNESEAARPIRRRRAGTGSTTIDVQFLRSARSKKSGEVDRGEGDEVGRVFKRSKRAMTRKESGASERVTFRGRSYRNGPVD